LGQWARRQSEIGVGQEKQAEPTRTVDRSTMTGCALAGGSLVQGMVRALPRKIGPASAYSVRTSSKSRLSAYTVRAFGQGRLDDVGR
jgi:hypothetical protein